MLKVGIPREHIPKIELLHHDHRRKICIRDVRFVAVSLPGLNGPLEAATPNPVDLYKNRCGDRISLSILSLPFYPLKERLDVG